MPTTAPQSRSAEVASTAEIRRRFPALERRHGGHPVAYFDGPGGTQVPRAGRGRRRRLSAPPQRQHPLALPDERGDRRADRRRARGARRLPRRRPRRDRLRRQHDDAHLPSRRAPSAASWGPGDEIVVTELDHHANVAPWRALERERGVTVRVVPMIPERGELDWTALEQAFSSRTRLLAHRRRVQRAGHDQRRHPRVRARARGGRPQLRRRRALRAARPRGRPGHRLRLPRLLGVQVLRSARRRAVRPARAASRRWTRPSWRPRPTRRRSGWRPARSTTRGSSARAPRWTSSRPSRRAPHGASG